MLPSGRFVQIGARDKKEKKNFERGNVSTDREILVLAPRLIEIQMQMIIA